MSLQGCYVGATSALANIMNHARVFGHSTIQMDEMENLYKDLLKQRIDTALIARGMPKLELDTPQPQTELSCRDTLDFVVETKTNLRCRLKNVQDSRVQKKRSRGHKGEMKIGGKCKQSRPSNSSESDAVSDLSDCTK